MGLLLDRLYPDIIHLARPVLILADVFYFLTLFRLLLTVIGDGISAVYATIYHDLDPMAESIFHEAGGGLAVRRAGRQRVTVNLRTTVLR